MHRIAPILALSLVSMAASANAGVLQQARFMAMNPDVTRLVSATATHALGSFQIIGERIVLENGNLTASVEKIVSDDVKIQTLKSQTTYTLNDDFFRDPVKAIVESFLKASDTTIARAEIKAHLSDENRANAAAPAQIASLDPRLIPIAAQLAETFMVDVILRDVKLPVQNKAFTMTAKVLVFDLKAQGTTAYDPATKTLVATVNSVKMGGIPVGLDLSFLVMGRFVGSFDFISLQKPNILINLGAFLP